MSSALNSIFPVVPVNTYRKSGPLEARVVEMRDLFSHDDPENQVKHIVFETKQDLNFAEGQSVGVLVTPETANVTKPVLRLYSIASAHGGSSSPNQVEICVKRVVYLDPETNTKKYGIVSNYLCDLKVGDSVSLTGPAGKHFLLPTAEYIDRPYIFFGTGTGIAPFRGMLQKLKRMGHPIKHPIYLFLGVKYQSELLYHEEWQKYNEWVSYDTALSRETSSTQSEKMYVDHLIEKYHTEMKEILSNPKTLIYLCGLKSMKNSIINRIVSVLSLKIDSLEYKQLIDRQLIIEVY